MVCGAGSTQRYGVRPSVCRIRPLQQRAAGLLLRARRVGDIAARHGRRRSSTGPQHGAQLQTRLQLTQEADETDVFCFSELDSLIFNPVLEGGSVAEWLACWTQA